MDKTEALNAAIKQIEKQFGKGTIIRLGEESERFKLKIVSTGILSLDVVLGVGGLPRGRIIELYGPESSGKTTVALHMIAEMQRLGGTAAFIDAEHAIDMAYARRLGVDIDKIIFTQPDTGEQGLEIVDSLARSAAMDIIVVDSVAALVPQAEIDGDMGSSHVGLHARMMSQAMRKLAGNVSKTETIVVFINQIREKVGVMFGNPEVTTGGRALKFYSTIRMEVRKGEAIKGTNNDIAGNRTKIKITKNKVAPPLKTAEFDIMYGEGVSRAGCLLELGVEKGLIIKNGSYFSYKNERVAQGKENAKKFLISNPDAAKEIETKILQIMQEEREKEEENLPLALRPEIQKEETIEEMPEDYDGSED
ncbi:MAG: recombinase RecA [Selenomonadaceae bacterium]|nr:recombinase RecA [Selenomonadaceae bacterium]